MKKLILSLAFAMMVIAPSSQAYKIGNSGYHLCYASNCSGALGSYSSFFFVTSGSCPTSTWTYGNIINGMHQLDVVHCGVSEMGFAGTGASYNSSSDTHVSLNTANKIGFDIDTDRVNCVDLGTHSLSSAAGSSHDAAVRFTSSCTFEYVEYDDHCSVTDGITTVNVPL